jgi:hypothetical protein
MFRTTLNCPVRRLYLLLGRLDLFVQRLGLATDFICEAVSKEKLCTVICYSMALVVQSTKVMQCSVKRRLRYQVYDECSIAFVM